jgi:glycine oxidase
MNKVIIVGGGLIGMLSARALLNRGYQVTILERGPFGGEASWAGGGILSPLYPWRYASAVNRLALASQTMYPALIDELKTATGIDPEYRRSGLLMLDVADIQQAQQWATAHKVPLELITSQQMQVMEPNLSYQREVAVRLPMVMQLRNPRFIKAMQAYLLQRGAILRADTEIADIQYSNKRIEALITTRSENFVADNVVIANGAWSGRLLRQTHIDLPIRPVRGQMVMLQGQPGQLNHIVLQGSHYLIPRADGQIIIGSTVEETGFDKSTTDSALIELTGFIHQLAPSLATLPVIEHWAGLRPGCGQGIPYIGQHPQIKGLYVNAGHYRNGIVMAPASAELLADLISGQNPAIDPQPYSLLETRSQETG